MARPQTLENVSNARRLVAVSVRGGSVARRTSKRVIGSVLSTLLLVPSVYATAQRFPAIAPGARVHVKAEKWYTGTLLSADSVALVLELDRTHYTHVVLRDSVRSLELSRGRHLATIRGAGIGLLAGALGGAFIGLASYKHCRTDIPYCFDVAPGVSVRKDAILFGSIGAGAGALIGSFSRRDTWAAAALDVLRIGVVPARGRRVGLAASIAF